MKITHRQSPAESGKGKKNQKLPLFFAVLAVALIAGIGLVAALDGLTAPETTDPDRTAEVNITTTQSSTQTTTTTTAKPTTSTTTLQTEPEKPLYVLPLSNNVIAEYSDTPIWNETMQSYRVHQAVDFGGTIGDKIVAVADGTVKAVYSDPLWGNCLELDCGYGIVVKYCGIQTDCQPEQALKVNQAIGTLDTVPCEADAEPHLHLEVSVDGTPIDVLKAIDNLE
ncbi:MAG: M23 family metallopeptidase [Clostridia bacterium]|nr:M23 family metallopeptidase [Clostridia bacterium]